MRTKPVANGKWVSVLVGALLAPGLGGAAYAAPPPTLLLYPRTSGSQDDVRALVDLRKKLRADGRFDVLTYDPASASMVRAAADAHRPGLLTGPMTAEADRLALTRALGATFFAVVSKADGRGKSDVHLGEAALGGRSWDILGKKTDDAARAIEDQTADALLHSPPVAAAAPARPTTVPPKLTAVSPPAVSPPAVSPPAVSPPAVSPPAVSPPAVSPPAVSPPAVSPPAVSPPAVSPPAVSPPAVSPPAVSPPAVSPPAVTGPVLAVPGPVAARPVQTAPVRTAPPDLTGKAPMPTKTPPPAAVPSPLPDAAPSPTVTRSPVPMSTTHTPAREAETGTAPPSTPPPGPTWPPADDLSGVKSQLRQGDDQLAQGDFVGAISLYRDAVNGAPLSTVPRLKLAQAYLEAGMRDKSLDEARRALQIAPGDVSLQQFLMQIDAQSGSADGAVARFDAQVSQNPKDPMAHVELGDALWNNNTLDQAEGEYKTAQNLAGAGTPPFEAAAAHLARLYAAQKRYDDSLAALKQAGPTGYALALGIVQSRADTLSSTLDSAQDAFTAGRSTHADFYKTAGDVSEQALRLADFVIKVTPPSAFKLSHLYRVQATHLLAQQAAVLVDYIETASPAQADKAAQLGKSAQTEMLMAHAAEQRLGLWGGKQTEARN